MISSIGLHWLSVVVNLLTSSTGHSLLRHILPGLRFNSGLTKIYALLLDNFVIYDSRVAAALTWLVTKWEAQTKLSALPDSLCFGCMRANQSKKSRSPELRQPDARFTYLNQNPYMHAHWNLRANWVLKSAFDKAMHINGLMKLQSLREVEAMLFAIGFDLKYAKPRD